MQTWVHVEEKQRCTSQMSAGEKKIPLLQDATMEIKGPLMDDCSASLDVRDFWNFFRVLVSYFCVARGQEYVSYMKHCIAVMGAFVRHLLIMEDIREQ